MRVLVGLILASVLSGQAAAQIEVYAATPRIWGASLSPDGAHLATGCSPNGDRSICIYDLIGGAAPIVIPAPDDAHMTGFYWPSPTYLIYRVESMQRRPTSSGMRTLRFSQPVSYSMATGRSSLLMAQARFASSLTDRDDRVAVEVTYALDNDARTGSNIGSSDDYGTVVYEMNLANGRTTRRLRTSSGSTFGFMMTPTGEFVLDVRQDDDSGVFSIGRIRSNSVDIIYSSRFEAEPPAVLGMIEGGAAALVRMPRDGLRRFDIETGELSAFDVGGMDVSRTSPIIDEYSSEVVGFDYIDDLPRQIFLAQDLRELQAELRQILTEDSVTIIAWSDNRDKLVVVGEDSGQPANYYLLDLTSGGLGLLDTELVMPEGSRMGARVAIEYPASDGLVIPAYITLPPGQTQADGPFPMIVMPHGGPEDRDTATYNWWSAYYASLGYVVLHPNFRGSRGYGQDFIEAGYGEFGGRMIEDIVDGAHYLQSQGIAREGQYCTSGWSYGGYAALMVALRDPENVACAISFAGVTDPFALMGNPDSDATSTRYWEQYMGPRFGSAAYETSITPVDRASEFRAPLLVIQGDVDVTVPPGQMLQLRNAMSGRADARFIMLEDENHQMRHLSSRVRVLEESTAFLNQYLPAD
jgi:dienelactone hydrolase